MPLSDESKFGVRALTTAINRVPATPTQIRELAIFKPEYLDTTYADVENQEGKLLLVKSKERGMSGDSLPEKKREIRTFRIPHLPVEDVVLADDVQNKRAFASTEAETVQSRVDSKLADGKNNLEYTREHLMLGALQGKILDADGSILYDLYKEFDFTRDRYALGLSNAKTEVGAVLDRHLSKHKKLLKGAPVTGWVALCGLDFLEKLKYHDSIKPLYQRFEDGALYRESHNNDTLNPIEFMHKGIKFIEYTGDFGESGAKIPSNEAILLPIGRNLYKEYFAPANMNETVNTTALPYYASREKMKHNEGWDLKMQSNPLPLCLRPELLATLTV